MKLCVLCKRHEVFEDSPILVMSAYGVPRYLCDECSADMECATRGRDYEKIREAMDRIGEKLGSVGADDLTIDTLDTVLRESAERALKIKDGSYDFSLDEEDTEDSPEDGIPEELLEAEEDKELDRRDEERAKKFDKVFNWITVAICIAAAVLIVYNLVERFAS